MQQPKKPKPKHTARTLLELLNAGVVNYVAFDYTIINSNALKMKVITTKRHEIINMLGLQPIAGVSSGKLHAGYTHPDCPGFEIHLYDKGRAIFPERFESEMLASRTMRGDLPFQFNGLDNDRRFWAQVYMTAIHENQGSPGYRAAVLDKLKERMGGPAVQSKYLEFGFYPA